ncbi:MAG: phosphomethylpyrimidine synthase ThiC [Thermoplasmata archaeon]|nr:phosphomethylpyrimidine synthase ThiC [Thermoplasmata archaeon]
MQVVDARNGRITEEMKFVAEKEGVDIEKLRRAIADGRAVIFKNILHDIEPVGVGKGLRVKVNANIGTSMDIVDVDAEIRKARIAKEYGADAIMDLSTGGNLDEIRRKIMKEVPIVTGTVPIYEAAWYALKRGNAIVEMSEDDMFNAVETHLKDGVDFVTIHAGVTSEAVEKMRDFKRVVGTVSRGGTFHAAWILHNNEENPFYKNFDYLLELLAEYDATISLGDGLRPGGLPDATDFLQIHELYTIGKLVRKAREKGVQAIVEGPGHIPIDQIEANVKMAKIATDDAPFYVLGPLVTDIASGYDHINGAIGGAIAAMAGADFLCYVTPAEHLALPNEEEVKEGVIATRIAAHAVNLIRFRKDYEWDLEMSKARGELRWGKQLKLSIDRENAEKIREERYPDNPQVCTMCGELCAIKLLREYLDEKR